MGKNIFAMCFFTSGNSKTKCRDLLRENNSYTDKISLKKWRNVLKFKFENIQNSS